MCRDFKFYSSKVAPFARLLNASAISLALLPTAHAMTCAERINELFQPEIKSDSPFEISKPTGVVALMKSYLKRGREVSVVVNGKRVTGTLSAFDVVAASVTIETDKGQMTFSQKEFDRSLVYFSQDYSDRENIKNLQFETEIAIKFYPDGEKDIVHFLGIMKSEGTNYLYFIDPSTHNLHRVPVLESENLTMKERYVILCDIKNAKELREAPVLKALPFQEKPKPVGQIPARAIISYFSAEALIVSREEDKALDDWLKAVNTTVLKDVKNATNVQKAMAIAKYVEKTFWRGEGSLLGGRKEYQRLTELDTVSKLGEFIANKTGVCRHMAVAMFLALKEAGIESKHQFVHLEVGVINKKGEFELDENESGSHALVVIKDEDGREYILDPMLKIYGQSFSRFGYSAPETEKASKDTRIRDFFKEGSEVTRTSYRPTFGSIQTPRPLVGEIPKTKPDYKYGEP